MSYIGLDIGLTGCKAVLFAEDTGEILARVYREYETVSPQPGWRELEPAVVWGKVKEVLSGLSEAAGRDAPRALSVSSHGESAVPVSSDGEDLANAIVPFDQRIKDLVGLWGGGLPLDEMAKITGQPPHQMYTLARIVWMRENRPEVVSKAWKFLCFHEYVLYRLGVKDPATSYSQAARTWAFDVHNKVWSEAVLSSQDLGEEVFAKAVPSATVVGEMDSRLASELGLPQRIKLVTGGHDQACAALGSGVMRPGLAVDSTGTVECITPTFKEPLKPEVVMKYNFCNSPHVVDGLYVTFGWNITGGSLLKWLRDKMSPIEAEGLAAKGLDFYAESLRDLPAGPSGLLVLPHMAGSGTPWFWEDSYGLIMGLDFDVDKKRFLKGLLEGVTFEMKYNLNIMEQEGIHVERFVCVGGGAKSDAWLQIKADVFDRSVVRTDVTEGACLGAAMICAHAIQGASYEDIGANWIRALTAYEPRPNEVARYREYFALYERMQETVRPLHRELHALRHP